MDWGSLVRHAAIAVGAAFVASAMFYLAIRLVALVF
jgi:hypothetical protein